MPNVTTREPVRPEIGAVVSVRDRRWAFLGAIRWSAVTAADTRTLQAPFRFGVDIEDHQLEPVARTVDAPRVNLLLADDVGLGRTIEAGLVAQELLLRHRVRPPAHPGPARPRRGVPHRSGRAPIGPRGGFPADQADPPAGAALHPSAVSAGPAAEHVAEHVAELRATGVLARLSARS